MLTLGWILNNWKVNFRVKEAIHLLGKKKKNNLNKLNITSLLLNKPLFLLTWIRDHCWHSSQQKIQRTNHHNLYTNQYIVHNKN